eukprot:2810022-Amphidinium_carterae.1
MEAMCFWVKMCAFVLQGVQDLVVRQRHLAPIYESQKQGEFHPSPNSKVKRIGRTKQHRHPHLLENRVQQIGPYYIRLMQKAHGASENRQ